MQEEEDEELNEGDLREEEFNIMGIVGDHELSVEKIEKEVEEDNKNNPEEEEEEIETPTTPLPEEIQAIMIKEPEQSEMEPEMEPEKKPEQPEPEKKSEQPEPEGENQSLPISDKDVDEIMEKIQPKIDQLIFYYWPILPKEHCHRWKVDKATAYFKIHFHSKYVEFLPLLQKPLKRMIRKRLPRRVFLCGIFLRSIRIFVICDLYSCLLLCF